MQKSIFSQLPLSTKIALILVVLTLLGWGVSCSFRNEVRPAARQVIRLVDIVHRNFQTKPDYWKLSSQWMIENNMVPSEMRQGLQIVNALGKPVLIGAGINGQMLMPGAKSFDIVYKDLSKRECVALATYEYPKNQTLGLIELTIVNENGEKSFVWGDKEGLPLESEEAAEICNKQNSLIWNFE